MAKLAYLICRVIRFVLDLFGAVYGAIFYPSKQRFLPAISDELLLLPAIELANRIKSGKLKSEVLIRTYIDRCKRINPDLNALIDDNFEQALSSAREIDIKVALELQTGKVSNGKSIHEYPFLGVPFTAKNSIMAKGKTFSGGTYARKELRGDRDSHAIERMKSIGGAVFLGVTNIPEGVMWQDSFNRVDGQTNNPYDMSRMPGGSSGGEAALIAAAGSVIGIGSDTAGSIRIPAHCCGVFGHKTTARCISTDGVFPDYSDKRCGINTLGPLCRYACDLRPMVKVLASESSLNLPEAPLDLSTLTVHYMTQLEDPIISPLDKQIEQGVLDVVKYFQAEGSTTKLFDTVKRFHDIHRGFQLWTTAMYDPGHDTFLDIVTNGNRSKVNPYWELVKCALGVQKRYTAAVFTLGIVEEHERRSGKAKSNFDSLNPILERFKKNLHKLLGSNGILLCPTFPEIAFKHHETLSKFSHFTYTAVWSALNVAITQVPLGLDRHGMPFGVQVIAAPHNDNLTIQVAEVLEKKFGGWVAPCSVKL